MEHHFNISSSMQFLCYKICWVQLRNFFLLKNKEFSYKNFVANKVNWCSEKDIILSYSSIAILPYYFIKFSACLTTIKSSKKFNLTPRIVVAEKSFKWNLSGASVFAAWKTLFIAFALLFENVKQIKFVF